MKHKLYFFLALFILFAPKCAPTDLPAPAAIITLLFGS